MNLLRLIIVIFLTEAISNTLDAKAFLQGTVSFLNSGSRPAVGVKISAFGANDCYTTGSGMFILEFPDKQPGDKIRLLIGGSDETGTPLELVNDKVVAQVRIPSKPDDDIIEIIVCKVGERNESALRYNGLIVKSINENTEKRLKQISEKLDASKIDAETIIALQKEKNKLSVQRDSALSKAEEQALFIASINLDKANQLVKDAMIKVDSLNDIDAAIAVLDNEMLLKFYEEEKGKVQKARKKIDKIIEGYILKIKLLESASNTFEINNCCMTLESICREQDIDISTVVNCFEWVVLTPHQKSDFNLEDIKMDSTIAKNTTVATATFVIQDFYTEKGIAGAQISIQQAGWATKSTDINGKVDFDNVFVGTINFIVTKNGYQLYEGHEYISLEPKSNIFRLPLLTTTPAVNDKIILITGQVSDKNERTVEGALVLVKVANIIQNGFTDESGSYIIEIKLNANYPSNDIEIEVQKERCEEIEIVEIPRSGVIYKDFVLDCSQMNSAPAKIIEPLALKTIGGFLFELNSCRQSGTSILFDFTITSKNDVNISLYEEDNKRSKITTLNGSEYVLSEFSLGDKVVSGMINKSFIENIPVRGMLVFKDVPHSVDEVPMLEFIFNDGTNRFPVSIYHIKVKG